jgi:hypothetical protein
MLIPFGVFSAGAGGGAAAGAYELISTAFGTGSSNAITFNVSGLGSTYKHLQLRATARSDSGTFPHAFIRFNSDTGSNYSRHYLFGDGSSVTSGGSSSQTSAYAVEVVGSASGANIYSSSVVDILDPFSASKNKTVRSLAGWPGAGIFLYSGAWYNTAAVTSITFTLNTGNFTTSSRFSLYGIRG